MKRTITDGSDAPTAKRVKVTHSTVFLDKVPEQCVADFLTEGVDEEKWITGKFKMVYPALNGKVEAIATIYSSPVPSNGLPVIPILFELSDKLLVQLDMLPLNEFRLSLRGAKVEKMPRMRHTCTLPLQLIYSSGVHILWKPQGVETEIKTLNTWLSTRKSTKTDNTWYSSGGEEEPLQDEARFTAEENNSAVEEPLLDIQPTADTLERHVAKQNKKRQRLEAKRLRQEVATKAAATRTEQSRDNTSSASVGSVNAISNKQPDNLVILTSSSPTNILSTSLHRHHNDSPNSSVSHAPDDRYTGGSNAPHISRYSSLNEIRAGQYAQVCGIIVDMSDKVTKTRTGDLMCYITIADPNSTRSDASGKWQGFKVNCFTKRHKEWLPHLQRGDVVILRDVKIEDYMGNIVGVGQHNRLRWAAYSPSAGEIFYGPPNNAPKEENLAAGFGAPFSPFYTADEIDIQHCISLSDWWRKVAEKDKSETVVSFQRGPKRLHRLISETGPNVQPNGYFDCTVEVLKLLVGVQGIHTIFATDYTISPGSGSSNKAWPAALNEYVIQLEMWDEAAQIAEATMKPGEYYSIKNARMRINKSGYMEGKVTQGKLTQLDEDDAENDAHLKALLERRKEWNSKNNTEVDSFQLIQDAELGNFFDCIVELIHIELNPHRMPNLYVTDYSRTSRLAATCGDAVWSRDLEGCIIKIMLDEEQRHVAETAVVGAIFSIRKLRLKFNAVENGICGILGGNEKLIVPMNINRTDNICLNDLIQRKIGWQKDRQHKEQNRKASSSTPVSKHLITLGGTYTRIKDMPLQDANVTHYRLIAKVIDFHPLELKDAFYRKCSSCNKEIPTIQKACVKCGDFDHEFLQYHCQMFILIEDQVGDQIKLSINDKCSLFNGLERRHLRDDTSAFRAFSARVGPLLGDLTAMHDGLWAEKIVEVQTPLLCFEIDTWIVSEATKATRAFSLSSFARI